MNNRSTIINELHELSALLAGSNPLTPYQVPDGYFNQLPEAVLTLVKEQELVQQLSKDEVYEVPRGYFDQLAGTILNKIKAEEAGSPAEELEHLSPLLQGIGKKQPYTVPTGYFDTLKQDVVAGVQAIEFVNEELENLSPLMTGLKAINVYTVPDGYFEQLPTAVLQNITTQQRGKVVSISFTRKVMRLAVAACVAGIIGIGGWFYFNTDKVQPLVPVAGAETIELKDNEKAILNTVSDEAIENFAEGHLVPAQEETAVAAADITPDDASDLFADIPDEQLEQYLEEHGSNTQTLNN